MGRELRPKKSEAELFCDEFLNRFPLTFDKGNDSLLSSIEGR